jgi:hypothetical protein
MRPDELSVLPNTSVADRLTRIERAVEGLAACLGLNIGALTVQDEPDLEANAIGRIEGMVVDLAEAVRLQALWVQEGERAGYFPKKQAVRARLRMELADVQGDLAQVERALEGSPHPDLKPALEQRARMHREKLTELQTKLDRLSLPPATPHKGA